MPLLLLFVVVPALELMLLLQVHHSIASLWGTGAGLLVTLGGIVVTGIAGAALARHQGIAVLRRLQESVVHGESPAQTAVDGVLILVGGVTLLTPGFVTDAFGLMLLIPFTRAFFRRFVIRWVQNKLRHGQAQVTIITPEYRYKGSEPVSPVPPDQSVPPVPPSIEDE